MFKNIVAKLRQVMYRMGLIKGIQKVTDVRDITVSEEMYNLIDMWKCIYSGYYEDWHKIKVKTLKGEKARYRASLRMGKIIAQKMATLIFTEKCEINIASDDSLKEFIANVLKENRFYGEFRRYLEYDFALGGMVMKPYLEGNKIKISYVTADCFVPISWSNSRINEGVFINRFTRGRKRYTHLEWHLWIDGVYTIKNELYETDVSSGDDIGVLVPLSVLSEDLEEIVRLNNVRKTTFVYLKPNIANNFDTSSPLGISLFANSLDTLKTLDIAFDSFQREFILGKKRIIVPASAIKTVIDPVTKKVQRFFDADDEVYQAMNLGDGVDNQNKLHDISIELRVEEHVAAINALLNLLAMQIGLDTGTFTFDGVAVKTATEVISEDSETFRTKQDHETNIEAAIQELVDAIIEIADTFDIFPRPDKYEVSVSFDDSIIEDQQAEINKQIMLITNRLNTRVRAIQKIFGMTEQEAEELLKKINEENKTPTANDVDVFGMS